MKKLLLFFTLLLSLVMANAQNNCPFHVSITIKDASCYNNGIVRFQLLDDGGNPTTATIAGLSDTRGYYIDPSTHEKKYSEYGVDSLVVEYGTMTVGYEAQCSDGHGGWVLLDTNTEVTVNTTYRIPSASALYAVANTDTAFGRWPTLSCKNTGRIQLKIEGGKFPFTITRKAHGSDVTAQTMVINNYQYIDSETGLFLNETDLTRFDYKDYYTFDSLPAGNWDFYVVDGCEYGLPRTGQIVEVVEYPKLLSVEVRNGNTADSNVVHIKTEFDKTSIQYQYQPLYRFANGTLGTTEWYPLPFTASGSLDLYDTVNTTNYCPIYNENLSIEYGLAPCSTSGPAKNFKITQPTSFYPDYSDFIDSAYVDDENPCLDKKFFHTWFYSIYLERYNHNDYNKLYFTEPLRWEYIDKDLNAVIKSEPISNPYQVSSLRDVDVENYYGSFYDTPRRINGRRQLVDAKGCIVYYQDMEFRFRYDKGIQISDWRLDNSVDEDHCCNTQRWIKVYEHYTSSASKDGMKVRLVRSPYGHKYNFEAVYHEATRSWTVTKSSLENMADIICNENGTSVTLYDYCLPSGPYHFEVLMQCDTFYLNQNYSFVDRYNMELTEEPTYTYTQKCTDRYIKPLSGEISLYKRNTYVETGEEKPVEIIPQSSYFQVISGPVGGYDDSHFEIGDSVRISLPGEYVVRFRPADTTRRYCDVVEFFDTLVYEGGTVEFDYEYAILCDSSHHHGNVYVKGKNGTLPYTYVLYSGPDKTGTELARNNTGFFENVNYDVDDVLSCYIEDACGAYFYINLVPLSLADAQKTWFDGGLDVTSSCEGSTISVHALSIGNVFSFEWRGPNGFYSESSDPQIFIPRDAGAGKYYVTLKNTCCTGDITDSVTLNVIKSPTLEILHDATVCPGETVNVNITPHTENEAAIVNYKVTIENASGITYYENSSAPNVTTTIPVVVSSKTKIYADLIDDGTCEYAFADDTVYLNLRTDIANSCTMITSDTMVCYNSDATFHAISTLEAPYTLRWYADYELTHLLKEDHITSAGQWSDYDTTALKQQSMVYVAIEKEGNCNTVYGLPTHTVNMTNGNATLACGETYRVYDSGGPDGNYAPNESYKYYFSSDDGRPLSIKFNDFDLAEGAKLYVISGDQLVPDSALYILQKGSAIPELIFSKGDKLTLWFMSSMHPGASGWSANVENKPGVAVADVWPLNHVYFYDDVCQNQTGNYDDPYNARSWSTEIANALENDVKKSGTYSYSTSPQPDSHGCDSVTTLVLTVNPAPHADTKVTITNLMGSYTWDKTGETYTETGLYSKVYTTEDGCDSLDLLYLTIIEVDTSTNIICVGDTTELGIIATAPDITWENEYHAKGNAIGDLLLDDGTIIKPDDYNPEMHATPKGVIFYLDESGLHGWALALKDAYAGMCTWSRGPATVYENVNGLHQFPVVIDAIADTAGYGNTMEIKRTAEAAPGEDFAMNAPAAYYCYYYDHLTGATGTQFKGWYMPSIGQLNILYLNRANVSTTLGKTSLSAQQLKNQYYQSSTEASSSNAYMINHLGTTSTLSGKTSSYNGYVRAICNF